MAARKFSEAQVDLMEKEYNAGLNSVSVKKVGDQIKRLAERTGLEEATVKTWINNRKRGPPPSCFPSTSDSNNESKAKKALRVPSISRQPSGYNMFAGNLFSNELRGCPISERNTVASRRWRELNNEEKQQWIEKANKREKPALEDLTENQKKKLVDAALHRIDVEMQNLSHYGGRGIAIVLRPYDDKLVMSSTAGDEEFLLKNTSILKEFSLFTSKKDPCDTEVTVKSVQNLLNKKYRECFDRVNVEYSKKGIKFNVEGWPEDVPFRQPSRLGGVQLRRIWEKREEISFSHNIVTVITQRECQSLVPESKYDEQEHSDHEDETEIEEVVSFSEETGATMKKAKSKSLVRKGDVIPLLAPGVLDCRFWLFLCGSKCKRDGSINGKWLDRIGETLEYRVLPCRDTTRENCILWNARKNCREVLSSDSFDRLDLAKGIFVLSVAAHNYLNDLADLQLQSVADDKD